MAAAPPPPPVITAFYASADAVAPNGTDTLNWTVTGATSLTLDNGIGAVAGTSKAVTLASTTITYTLTATNAGGSATAQVTVIVDPLLPALTWKRDIVYLGAQEVAEYDANGMHVTHTDHLGSPRFITNAAGSVESRQKYLPFGETLDSALSGTYAPGKGFTNHEQTDLSGAIYMQARYYLPQWHRFTATDPARDQHFEETQSWNIYSYVQNDPTMRTDPTGMVSFVRFNRTRFAVDGLWDDEVPGGQGQIVIGRDETLYETAAQGSSTSAASDAGAKVSPNGTDLAQTGNTAQTPTSSDTGAASKQAANLADPLSGEGSAANLDRRAKIGQAAYSYNGDTSIAYPNPTSTPTCNVFVAQAVSDSGAATPMVTKADGTKAIPGAQEWAKSPIANWRFLKAGEAPKAGDVAAVPDRGRPGYSAHSMIVYNTDGGKVWVMESGRHSIHPRDVTRYVGGDLVFRRYTGD